ncbi:AAA family ATPase [Azorhizobium oxalatiphilum]|nr:AAA family ATPase [Azorhizobium oxalatiphilum]
MSPSLRIVLSGCSGGGKSTLLAELARRGHRVVEEPGRRIVIEEQESSGTALPWVDMAAFARRAVEMARADLAAVAEHPGPVFFDRGLIDAASALEHAAGIPLAQTLADGPHYASPVFLTPPWPEIHSTDAQRQLDFAAAVAEYERLLSAFPASGYAPVVLPRASVADRADLVLATLKAG